MVDTVSLIIGILAVIIAIVAIVLVFVIPGAAGPTGPTGTSDLQNFTKVMGNATASSTQPVALVKEFTSNIPMSVIVPYTNPSLLYNIVYNQAAGVFTLAANSDGYYNIYSENGVTVDLTSSIYGNTTLSMEILIGTVSVATSSTRVWFDAGTGDQVSLVMMSVAWQGNLKAGDNISLRITVNSLYNGILTYNQPNISRIMINGISKFQNS